MPPGNLCPKTRQGLYSLRNANKRIVLKYELYDACYACSNAADACPCNIVMPAKIVIFKFLIQIQTIIEGNL